MNKTKSHIRYPILDYIRGIAIALMFIYHFCFGLAQLGYLHVHFTQDIFWISFRIVIVFLFLGLVGIGLIIATRNGLNSRSFAKRLGLLFLYFLLITLLSHYVRPSYTVYFGILHLIFVASILGLFFIRFYWLNLLFAIIVIFAGNYAHFDNLNKQWLVWLGLTDYRPPSDDFAPIFPWFAFVLIGLFIGKYFFIKKKSKTIKSWDSKFWFNRLLIWGGRYSIHLYFVHFQFFYVLVYFFG